MSLYYAAAGVLSIVGRGHLGYSQGMKSFTDTTLVHRGEWTSGSSWEIHVVDYVPDESLVTAVLGFAYDSDGKIILTRNHRGWDLPGGHVEPGETIIEALHREMHEEAGIHITAQKQFACMLVRNVGGKINKTTNEPYPDIAYIPYYFVEFTGEPVAECIAEECFESRAFDFWDPEVQECRPVEYIRMARAIRLSLGID